MNCEIIKEEEIKLALLGDANVGKTSILNRFMKRDFNSKEINTIGMEQSRKKLEIEIGNQKVISILKIYDSAGQERYKSIALNYIKTIDGIILIFDISNRKSFFALNDWIKKIKDDIEKKIKMIVIGNKNDLEKKVEENEINDLLNLIKKKNNDECSYLESSAKNNYNIDLIFQTISEEIINHRLRYGRERKNTFRLNGKKKDSNHDEKNNKKKECC